MTWRVYGLIDSRNGEVFYVGLSRNPFGRMKDHCNDSASSAWSRCQEISEDGRSVELCLFGEFETPVEAKVLEGRLILALPTVCNKKSFHGLPSSTMLPDWQDVRKSFAVGDGVALTSVASPPGLTDAMAKAIQEGKLSETKFESQAKATKGKVGQTADGKSELELRVGEATLGSLPATSEGMDVTARRDGNIKRGRGRPKVEGKREWELAGVSRRTWYRRQDEKTDGK